MRHVEQKRLFSPSTRVLSVDEVVAAARAAGHHAGEPLARWERRLVRSAGFDEVSQRLAA